jgi:hypothetical protein
MKKTFLILLTIASTFSISAQEKTKQKEIGITFSNLHNFGLSYKFGNSNSVWRINTLFASGSNIDQTNDSLERNNKSSRFTLKFGKEYRKTITDKLEFRYGADLSFGYQTSETVYDDKSSLNNDLLYKTLTYRPGANLIIGFNYLVSENIVLGAEILPGFNYITGTHSEFDSNNIENETEISGYYYGLSNTSALLTLAYRF